jgi:hypothetical protein
MHHRLSQLLEKEVVGEVVQVGDGLFDAALGRICLDRLDPQQAYSLAKRVQREFEQVSITDRLYLKDRQQPIRGVMEVQLRDPEMDTLYLLQITSHTIVAYLERRFMLREHVYADLRGMVCDCTMPLATAEPPFKMLADFDTLYEKYLEGLNRAVERALEGQPPKPCNERPEKIELSDRNKRKPRVDGYQVDEQPAEQGLNSAQKRRVRVEYLDELPHRRIDPEAEHVIEQTEGWRQAWELIPWSLKETLDPVSRPGQERLCHHDRVLDNTVLFGSHLLEGDRIYQYEHTALPGEKYDKVMSWMTQLHDDMRHGYPLPDHRIAMAHASSADLLITHFPGFLPAVGRLYARPPTRSYA